MAQVDAAEKEASEVLHTLLSVERIEKQEVIVDADDPGPQQGAYHAAATGTDGQEADAQIQWHTPVNITHSIFSSIDANGHFDDHQVVIWEGPPIDGPTIDTIYSENVDQQPPTDPLESPKTQPEPPPPAKPKTPPKPKKKVPVKKKKKPGGGPTTTSGDHNDPTKLEESSAQVKERFKRGCECQDESCFRGLNPDSVYKHRLNIAELTKGEHDMYLMGVTMACLANPDTTVRHKERRRLRAQYVYQGRRVCLDAFLYLENCTHYQLKRIRKHVMTHGVAPRVHGNHGKKPHNTFSLDIYRHATEFLKQYLESHTGEREIVNAKGPIQLPWDVTRKNLHDAYQEYGRLIEPDLKLMGYSTFRHFMKEQFPQVKFSKMEPKSVLPSQQQQQQQQPQQQQQVVVQQPLQQQQQQQQLDRKCIVNDVQQVIPLVVAPQNDAANQQHHQQAFLVTPVPQILQNGNIVQQGGNGHNAGNSFSYQLTNTGYVINEQGNLVTAMATTNGQQHHAPYTFSRI